MLTDDIEITVTAGHGGPGKVSFGKKRKSGPDGGNGGKGGDVYLVANSNLWSLNQFTRLNHFEAGNGQAGDIKLMYGLKGKDIEIQLPIGTTVTYPDLDEPIEITKPDQRIRICKGGWGGKGNFEFRSSTNTTPLYAQPGLPGQTKRLHLVLKFLARYGLIGLPNAGKSSLLNELTNAKAEVGDFPFTTLEPNLGVCNGQIIADIPGLIEGASSGKGLGIKFLKHIEKVILLLHCISAESEDVIADFNIVNTELKKFNPELNTKKRLLLLTKTDLIDDKRLKSQITKLKKLKYPIHPISIHNWDSLESLKQTLNTFS